MWGDERLTEFFLYGGRDHAGRTHAEIVAWGDSKLERVHDYVQWLFPLPTASEANPDAPVLRNAERLSMLRSAAMKPTFRAGFRRMMAFYGFVVADEPAPDVQFGPDFAARAAAWITPNNHNFQRLSRILASATLLGGRPYAQALLRRLLELAERHPEIDAEAVSHWTTSAWISSIDIG